MKSKGLQNIVFTKYPEGDELTQPLEPASQQVLVPVPSPDKWGGLAAGRASGYKKLCQTKS